MCLGGAAAVSPDVATAGGGAPGTGAPVLSARRAPAALAEQVGTRVVVEAVDSVGAASPSRHCLIVGRGSTVLATDGVDDGLVPASGMKLLTASAVLEYLDEDERLRTAVVSEQEPVDGVVDGALYLVGGGDSVLGTSAWAADQQHQPATYTSIEGLADAVVASGVREVRGGVVGDDARYDDRRVVADWPTRYREIGAVGSLGALTVDDGYTRDRPSPRPSDDPALDAAATFADLLRERGVTVLGGASSGRAPAARTELAHVDSPTIGELVQSMLRVSDNETAELLTKELGLRVRGEGSTTAGTAVIVEWLAARELPTEGVEVRDGSGLSPADRVTCRLLAAVLRAEGDEATVADGLAVAGESGTLADRLVATPAEGAVRAKTGSLNDVSTLAGWVDTPGGSLWFAYIQNDIRGVEASRVLWDRLALALVDYPGIDIDTLGPSGWSAPGG